MACSIHIIWIISIKEHCFFNLLIFFWPLFLFINFLHSFHLTYKLSPASLPKKFTKLFDTMFEPIKLSKKEFKLLTQHSLVINLNRGENYLVENQSPIDEKVAILLEGRLDVTHNGVFLHHIYPNDFIDSPEFKLSQLYSERRESLANLLTTRPLTTRPTSAETGKTCSNCKQVFVDIENGSSIKRQASAASARSVQLSTNPGSKTSKDNGKPRTPPRAQVKGRSKSAAVKPQLIDDRPKRDVSNQTADILFIDSPIKEKLGFGTAEKVNKLAQVTITASENCKLLCWKRNLLVEETLANNLRLKTIFNNLIGRDIIQKLYCVNEEQRKKQQQIIGESGPQKGQTVPCPASKLLAHNPLKGDNLLSKFREVNLLNAYPYTPFIPHESLIYLNQYNRNLNIGLAGVLNQDLKAPAPGQMNLNYYQSLLNSQAILNPPLVMPTASLSRQASDQQQFNSLEINS